MSKERQYKILHVVYSGLGGHGNVFFSLIEANTDPNVRFEALFHGVEAVREEYIKRCAELNIPWSFVSKDKRIDPGYYAGIVKNIRQSTADLVFLHSSTLIFAARMGVSLSRKKKRIMVRETQANHLKTKGAWVCLKAGLSSADDLVFLTKEYRDEVHNRYPRLFAQNEHKVTIIPNGIDMESFRPHNLSDTQPVLTFAMQSRLVGIKDHSTLLQAFALYRKQTNDTTAILKIAGEGPTLESLQKLATQLGLSPNVRFTGLLEEPDLIEFLNTTDIYIHATYGETMSTAIMQAMACRLPIIASDVKGVQNMISHGTNGLLVEVENIEAMADAMMNVVKDRQLRQRIAQSAYVKAEQEYSHRVMSKRYMDLVQRQQPQPGVKNLMQQM